MFNYMQMKRIFSVIGYTSRESATKALEKMSGKEVDGQTVQVCVIVHHHHCASHIYNELLFVL